MKFLASPASYTFNAAAGTLVFTAQIPARQALILSVCRAAGGILYQPQQGGALFTGLNDFGGTWNSGTSTLSFAQDTSSYANTDDLNVWLDDGQVTLSVDLGAVALETGGNLDAIASWLPTLDGGRVPVTSVNAAQESGGNLANIFGRLPALDAGRIPVTANNAAQETGGNLAGIFSRLPALDAGRIPVTANNAAQETGGNLANIFSRLPVLDAGRIPVALPPGSTGLTNTELRAAPVPTSLSSPPFMRAGFAEVGSGIVGKAAEDFALLQTGSGMTVSQSGGNLVVTTGTTANAETVIQSVDTFTGSMLARFKVILSQRIVNQTFRFELADLIGSGLSYTINSATSVTVTFPTTNPFTAANVGQSVRLSMITGAAGIPGRYAIASVAGLTVTFTVAAWPATGSGTLMLYGWNYLHVVYDGTSATTAAFDTQRRGWNSGNSTPTVNTTASPGHVAQLGLDVFTAGFADALVASNAGYQWTSRASRIENVPDPDVALHLFIVVQNGSTAPASTTTLTVGFAQVEDQTRQKVRVAGSDPVGSHALPVQVLGGLLGTQPVSGTVTANAGTGTMAVSLATNTPALAAGTNLAADVGQQYRANATGASTPANANCPATPAPQAVKASAGRLMGFALANSAAATRWLKFWNTAAGSVTMGTTAALFELALPPGQPAYVCYEGGLGFGTAITVAITGGQGLTNNTAVALGDVTGFFSFA